MLIKCEGWGEKSVILKSSYKDLRRLEQTDAARYEVYENVGYILYEHPRRASMFYLERFDSVSKMFDTLDYLERNHIQIAGSGGLPRIYTPSFLFPRMYRIALSSNANVE